MENCDTVLPVYLRFVRGVVDSEDLQLNVSRETLQENRTVRQIEQQLTKLGETQMAYQTTLNLYRKHLDLLRTALTRPGR